MPASFTKVARQGELAPGEMKLVALPGERILLVNLQGEYLAVGERCPHADGPLAEGWLEGEVLECPWHGGQFNVRTGAVLSPPATQGLPRYQVRLDGDEILVGPPA